MKIGKYLQNKHLGMNIQFVDGGIFVEYNDVSDSLIHTRKIFANSEDFLDFVKKQTDKIYTQI